MTTQPVSGPTREEFAQRLLKGSARKSYAPVVDIDWDAPLEPDTFFLPPTSVTLYGTPIWEQMSRAEQIELSRQELVNLLSAGVWFENILNQALLRDLMHKDVTAHSTHYSLTELGDETRHMVMFGKTIERIGAKPIQPRRWQRWIINLLPLMFRGPILWGAALVGEEIFDSLQRLVLEDPDIQPIVKRLMRIHVTEEARHIQYARDGLRRTVPRMSRRQRMYVSTLHGVGGPFYRFLLTNKTAYRRLGLDAREAKRAALANPHHQEHKVLGFAPLAEFFVEVGLMNRVSRAMWRRAGFLPA